MNKEKTLVTAEKIYQQIREVLIQARSRAMQAVNTEMVACYWQIGRLIVEEEQRGETRAEYGKRLIEELSSRLKNEFGKGFHPRNLWFMRTFFLAYPKMNALRSEFNMETGIVFFKGKESGKTIQRECLK